MASDKSSADTPSRFKRVLGSLAAIAIGIVGASVVALPAAYVAPLVTHFGEGKVSLANARGRLWDGSGDLTLALGGPPLMLRDLQWSVRPARLFAGELCVDLTMQGPEISGTAQIARGFSSVVVRDAKVNLPAQLVASRSPFLQTWDARGTVAITARSLELSDKRFVGDGEIRLSELTAARLGALGDYRIVAAPAGDRTALTLATTGGALLVNGTGELGPAGDFRIRGTATTDAENRPRLGAFLAILGPTQPDGAVTFQWPIFGGPTSTPIQRRGAMLGGMTQHG